MNSQTLSAFRAVLTGFGMLATLAACAVGPDFKRPVVALPAAYPAQTEDAAQAALAADWWTIYQDPRLDELVKATLQNNTELERVLAQIEEAEAVLDESGASLFPQVELGASSARSRSSTLNAQRLPAGTPPISNSHRLALSASFEVDFWGKLQRATEAARAQVWGTRYARDVIALTLAGTTTQAYFALRALDAQIAVTQQTLTSRDDTLAVMKKRAEGGLASELELNQSQGARADAALQLRELQRQRALVEHQLGTLTGHLDLKIAAGDLADLSIPPTPPVGLPSTLLERRPDIQLAEQELIAANAQIGTAKAAQFPTFSLIGNFGGQSEELGNLLKAGARIWSMGLDATMPIIDSGRYAARTRQAEARHRQSLAGYRKSVETAFQEVADALSNIQQTRAAVTDQQAKLDAARNGLRLSELRYKAGYSGYLEVLDAQRSAYAAELALVQNRQAQLVYSVDLMKALGGGWSPAGAAPLVQR